MLDFFQIISTIKWSLKNKTKYNTNTHPHISIIVSKRKPIFTQNVSKFQAITPHSTPEKGQRSIQIGKMNNRQYITNNDDEDDEDDDDDDNGNDNDNGDNFGTCSK